MHDEARRNSSVKARVGGRAAGAATPSHSVPRAVVTLVLLSRTILPLSTIMLGGWKGAAHPWRQVRWRARQVLLGRVICRRNNCGDNEQLTLPGVYGHCIGIRTRPPADAPPTLRQSRSHTISHWLGEGSSSQWAHGSSRRTY